MGRGFGRGAKSVAIVTHAQVKGGQKKLPKGLRGSRKARRRQFSNGEQGDLEQSMGMRGTGEGAGGAAASTTVDGSIGKKKGNGGGAPRSMAQEIASVHFSHVINKRQRGFKQLRKQLIDAVKVVRRKHHDKNAKANKRNNVTQKELMAQQYRDLSRKNVEKPSGNERRLMRDNAEQEESSDDDGSSFSGSEE